MILPADDIPAAVRVATARGATSIFKIGILLVVVSLHALIFCTPLGQRFELLFADKWFELRGAIPASNEIVVVAMDEPSYRELQVPLSQGWPRKLHAQLIRRLAALGAKRVIFDVLFVGASEDPIADKELSEAISSMPVILGAELSGSTPQGFSVTQLLKPDEFVGRHVESLALVNLPEESGHVRQFLALHSEQAYDLKSFAEAAAGNDESGAERGASPDSRALINYYAPAGHGVRVFSYYQLLEKEMPFPQDLVRNKTVFVGLMLRTELGPAQKDSFLTPFGRMFGVEIHATAAANILEHNWIQRASQRTELLILSIIALGILHLVISSGPLLGAAIVSVSILAWGAYAAISLSLAQFVPGAVLLCAVTPLTYLATTLKSYLLTRRKQREVERAFGHYLAPAMVQQLALNPDALRLGGELVDASAMFTDLADFTTISENLSAQELIRLLNAYFSVIAKVVFDEGGTLIKFIGDAMFVLWGAPLHMQDHAARAVRAASRIQQALVEFNQSAQFPALVTRIGINSGSMVVGNLGAETRFDYTAIGDAVNLASRVEGINKYLGTEILVTETTLKASGVGAALRMGTMQVKGKELPVILYALFPQPLDESAHTNWKTSLRYFQSRRWDDARQGFALTSSLCPLLATACEFYCEQIETLTREGAAAGWKGEIIFTSK